MDNSKTRNSRKKTLADLKIKLNKFGKCVFIRPTGFGKTWTLAEIIKSGKYKQILYMYPAEVVKDALYKGYISFCNAENEKELAETVEMLGSIPNCEMMTYAKASRIKDDEIDNIVYMSCVYHGIDDILSLDEIYNYISHYNRNKAV